RRPAPSPSPLREGLPPHPSEEKACLLTLAPQRRPAPSPLREGLPPHPSEKA
ncbi:hypothetical protein NDU88_007723, partial [Pleurodeles waltl]